jgi:hypothetical protein
MLGSIARRSVVLSSRRSATRNLRRASRGTSSISARTPTRTVSVNERGSLRGLTYMSTIEGGSLSWGGGVPIPPGAVQPIRGGGLPGSPPPPRRLYAADRMTPSVQPEAAA